MLRNSNALMLNTLKNNKKFEQDNYFSTLLAILLLLNKLSLVQAQSIDNETNCHNITLHPPTDPQFDTNVIRGMLIGIAVLFVGISCIVGAARTIRFNCCDDKKLFNNKPKHVDLEGGSKIQKPKIFSRTKTDFNLNNSQLETEHYSSFGLKK